jgi:hypothetical protein
MENHMTGRPPNRASFKPGNAGGPGRPRGSVTRVMADLSQLIMDAATETGFVKVNKETGMPEGTGEEGCYHYD